MNNSMLTRRVVVTAFVLLPLAAQAKSPEIYTGLLSSVGAGGFDPVAALDVERLRAGVDEQRVVTDRVGDRRGVGALLVGDDLKPGRLRHGRAGGDEGDGGAALAVLAPPRLKIQF